MIDSHCHLTAPEFSSDIDAVIARAKSVGVRQMIVISDAMGDLPHCQKLSEAHEEIFWTAGVHPHHAKDVDLARDLPLIREALAHPLCRGVGEIGLDYHYMNSPKDIQQRIFEAQLVLAKELNVPAVVHCREAVEDVWTIVNHVRPPKLVIHCCTERWEDVVQFVDAGYLLSFTGIVTYPKSDIIRETVKQCPLSSLMVETDAPFLAPVPHRGKRSEPAHVMEVAKKVAEIKSLDLAEVDRVTTDTAMRFFGL